MVFARAFGPVPAVVARKVSDFECPGVTGSSLLASRGGSVPGALSKTAVAKRSKVCLRPAPRTILVLRSASAERKISFQSSRTRARGSLPSPTLSIYGVTFTIGFRPVRPKTRGRRVCRSSANLPDLSFRDDASPFVHRVSRRQQRFPADPSTRRQVRPSG